MKTGLVNLRLLAAMFVVSSVEAASVVETFDADPATSGWKIHGGEMFEWDEAEGTLNAVWDSEEPNSYFHLPLPFALTDHDDFEMSFDLSLSSVEFDFTTGSLYAYEVLSIGLIDTNSAFADGFKRTVGSASPSLIEFDYFPDTGFKDTVAVVAVDRDSKYAPPSHNFPLTMEFGEVYSVTIRYSSEDRTVRTTMLSGGVAHGAIKDIVLPSPAIFAGFSLNAFSVSAYHDFTPWGRMAGAGTIDNVTLTMPDPPEIDLQLSLTSDGITVEFEALAGWQFRLLRSDDLLEWSEIAGAIEGDGLTHVIDGGDRKAGQTFYRTVAQRVP